MPRRLWTSFCLFVWQPTGGCLTDAAPSTCTSILCALKICLLSSFDIAATSLNSSRSARIDLLQVIPINQSINQSINFAFSQLRKSDRCLASFLFFLAVNYLAFMKSQLFSFIFFLFYPPKRWVVCFLFSLR